MRGTIAKRLKKKAFHFMKDYNESADLDESAKISKEDRYKITSFTKQNYKGEKVIKRTFALASCLKHVYKNCKKEYLLTTRA